MKEKPKTADTVEEPIERISAASDRGLTDEQVNERIARGAVNTPVKTDDTTLGDIIRENVFTYFNLLFLVIAVCLFLVGSFRSLTFLPVIIALLLNGFDFQRLELGGSAVWFCIAVPIVPVYLIKFGIVELYEKPLIYILKENGRKKRYRKKSSFKIDWDIVKMVLRACFVPPASLAVWFGIICFCTICYLTAFGFD